MIERELPRAGNLSAEELQGISQTSCNVLNEIGSQIVPRALAEIVDQCLEPDPDRRPTVADLTSTLHKLV